MQHLQPNTTLQGGKYRIERVLGQGGFGITYLATQLSLQRKVAIKEFFMKDFCSRDESTRTMSAPSTGSSKLVEQYRKKFIKEARNLARLNHPHIISVIDVFEENGTVYYVMPYLIGGSLQDYVKTHGTLSEQEAMKYVKQIASALKYMHEELHICHYDVKPANILLDNKGDAVLIDFGISKNYDASGHQTSTTPIGLSEGYAPIEQYQQNVEEFSPASDVYALGATLYFLLHGKRPVNAPCRAGGVDLLMKKNLSQGVKDIIIASMNISKRERAKSVDVFFGNIATSSHRKPVQDDDESTIIESRKDTYRNWLMETLCRIFGNNITKAHGTDIDLIKDLHATPEQIDKLQFEIMIKYGHKMPNMLLMTFDSICSWLVVSDIPSRVSEKHIGRMDGEETLLDHSETGDNDGNPNNTFDPQANKVSDKDENGCILNIIFWASLLFIMFILSVIFPEDWLNYEIPLIGGDIKGFVILGISVVLSACISMLFDKTLEST